MVEWVRGAAHRPQQMENHLRIGRQLNLAALKAPPKGADGTQNGFHLQNIDVQQPLGGSPNPLARDGGEAQGEQPGW